MLFLCLLVSITNSIVPYPVCNPCALSLISIPCYTGTADDGDQRSLVHGGSVGDDHVRMLKEEMANLESNLTERLNQLQVRGGAQHVGMRVLREEGAVRFGWRLGVSLFS